MTDEVKTVLASHLAQRYVTQNGAEATEGLVLKTVISDQPSPTRCLSHQTQIMGLVRHALIRAQQRSSTQREQYAWLPQLNTTQLYTARFMTTALDRRQSWLNSVPDCVTSWKCYGKTNEHVMWKTRSEILYRFHLRFVITAIVSVAALWVCCDPADAF